MIRILLVLYFILAAIRLRVAPWRFFQLNANYFNEQKGLFSKLDLDAVIPEKWRLKQVLDDGTVKPSAFPVFVKPEWGQNAYGVSRADSQEMLDEIRKRTCGNTTPFILQDAASGAREFEIFYIRSSEEFAKYAILTVTETENSAGDSLPVNSIKNPLSTYHDCTKAFTQNELEILWKHVGSMGAFRLARVGLRANSLADILAGKFQIIEINIFLPMPLSLLDEGLGWFEKHRCICAAMTAVAKMVKTLPKGERGKRIFFRKVRAHYRVKKTGLKNERNK